MNKYLILFLICFYGCTEKNNVELSNKNIESDPDKTKVLLLGTSHFQTFDPTKNYDVAQVNQIDVLTQKNQNELEEIADKIAIFNPTKIFVERTLSSQAYLDSIYQAFNITDYSQSVRDELEQIAFRVGKKLGHKKVYAMDFRDCYFPYSAMIQEMEKAGQTGLIDRVSKKRSDYQTKYNAKVKENQSVKDILLFLNGKAYRDDSLELYVDISTSAGAINDTMGVFLSSEWFRRNLFMHSYIQKQTDPGEKIMILAGASHVALFKNFLDFNKELTVVELTDLL